MNLHGFVECSIVTDGLRRDFVFRELGSDENFGRGESGLRQKASLIWEIVCRIRCAELRGHTLGLQDLYLDIGITRPTLTRSLDLLERCDAVIRRRDHRDSRRILIILCSGFRKRFDDCAATMISTLNARHHEQFSRAGP